MKDSDLTLLIESIIRDRLKKYGTPMIVENFAAINFFFPKEFLVAFITALFRLDLADSDIYDILKFGIDNIKEIRELRSSLEFTKEILEESYGKE